MLKNQFQVAADEEVGHRSVDDAFVLVHQESCSANPEPKRTADAEGTDRFLRLVCQQGKRQPVGGGEPFVALDALRADAYQGNRKPPQIIIAVAKGAGFTGTDRREIGRVEVNDRLPKGHELVQCHQVPVLVR